jgi:predicted RNA-binding Zn-ribbon protein involved in translation (DUF1610 family)
MKKVFMTLTALALTASISFAQAPAKPADAAPAKAKEAVKPVMDAAKAAPVDAAQAAPAKVKKAKMMAKPVTGAASTHAMEIDSTHAATMKVRKTKKMAIAATSTAMTFKCPKGDAVSDGGGKCPKCGTEMVSMGAEASPKKAVKKAAKKAPKMEAAPAKMEEKKG